MTWRVVCKRHMLISLGKISSQGNGWPNRVRTFLSRFPLTTSQPKPNLVGLAYLDLCNSCWVLRGDLSHLSGHNNRLVGKFTYQI